jgi:hypothetical protein
MSASGACSGGEKDFLLRDYVLAEPHPGFISSPEHIATFPGVVSGHNGGNNLGPMRHILGANLSRGMGRCYVCEGG